MTNEAESSPTEEQALVCPHCIESIGQFDHFCPHCGGPVTNHAATDPLGQIFAAGWAYHRAAKSSRPSFIVLVGMWLIFGPQLPLLAFGGLINLSSLLFPGQAYRYGGGSMLEPISKGFTIDLLQLLLLVGLFVVYSLILWKVTARYCRHRKSADGSSGGA